MQEAVLSPLATWQNFYVIIGSATATLTGLMFVVMTLIAGVRERRSSGALRAFTTPTVVHFGAVLLVAAILSAPWQALWPAGLLLGLSGLGGVTYIIIELRRALRQTDYQAVLSDWLWYMVLPLVSYTALVVAAILLPGHPAPALFVIAAATGGRDAWASPDASSSTIAARPLSCRACAFPSLFCRAGGAQCPRPHCEPDHDPADRVCLMPSAPSSACPPSCRALARTTRGGSPRKGTPFRADAHVFLA